MLSIGVFVAAVVNAGLIVIFALASTAPLRPQPTNSPLSQQQRDAREVLGRLGVPYSRESFFTQILERDHMAIEAFLASGIDATSKGASGLTPMEAALQTGDQDIVGHFRTAQSLHQRLHDHE